MNEPSIVELRRMREIAALRVEDVSWEAIAEPRAEQALQQSVEGDPIWGRLLDEARQLVWEQTIKEAPNPSKVFELGGGRNVPFTAVFANYPSIGHDPASTVIHPAGKAGKRTLTLTTPTPIDVPSGSDK